MKRLKRPYFCDSCLRSWGKEYQDPMRVSWWQRNELVHVTLCPSCSRPIRQFVKMRLAYTQSQREQKRKKAHRGRD